MINVIMVGSVQVPRPKEKFVAKPMYVPKFSELVTLTRQYEAYIEYAENAKSRQTANDAWVIANNIKRHLDKIYKRWRRG